MLTNKEAKIPNNLISLAKKTPGISAGIVCANHDSSMDSTKKAVELNLITPVFIGDKNAIYEKANQFKWDVSSYEIFIALLIKKLQVLAVNLHEIIKLK